MKPNINLNSPIVKFMINKLKIESYNALNVEQSVEKAVIPIYIQGPKRIMQTGSGVLIKIQNEFFIFSASHVLDEFGTYAILTGDGKGNPIQQLTGERFSTPRDSEGKHLNDILDASVFHIQSEISDSLKEMAISIEDFDNDNSIPGEIFLSAGFRNKKSNTKGNAVFSKREAFTSIEIGEKDYELLGLNPQIHIALWHEKQHLMDNRWQLSPTPRGFSGGAIIKIKEIKTQNGIEKKQVLSGIITEHRKKSNKIEGVLIGTRVNVHMAAIQKFIPSII